MGGLGGGKGEKSQNNCKEKIGQCWAKKERSMVHIFKHKMQQECEC